MKKTAPKIKRKKMADGGPVYDTTGWTPDQINAFNNTTDPLAKQKLYDQIRSQQLGTTVVPIAAKTITDLTSSTPKAEPKLPDYRAQAPATISASGKGVGSYLSAGASTLKTVGDAASKDGQGSDLTNYGSTVLGDAAAGFTVGGPWGAAAGAAIGITTSILDAGKKKALKQQQADTTAESKVDGLQDHLAKGGQVKGPGGPTDDLIETSLKPGSFVVPAKNAKAAMALRKQYLGESTGFKKGGSVPVALSNGEHVFTPEEVAHLKKQGITLDALAPEASETYTKRNGGKVYLKPKPGAKQVVNAQMPQLKAGGGLVQKLAAGTGPEGVQPAISFDADKFSEDLLKELNLPVTATRKKILQGWMEAEGNKNGTGFNPMNTSWTKNGSTIRKNKDGSVNGAGVKDYSSYEDGVKAMADTLKATKAHPEYQKILNGLKDQDISETYAAIASSPYGTKAGVLKGVKDRYVKEPSFAENKAKDVKVDVNDALTKAVNATKNEQGIAAGYTPKAGDDYIIPDKFGKNKPTIEPVDPLDELADKESKQAKIDETKVSDQIKFKPAAPTSDEQMPAAGERIQGSRKTIQDLLDEQAGVGTMNVPVTADGSTIKPPPITPGQNVFDKLGGWGGMVALGQTAFGLTNLLSIGKRPIDQVDPTLLTRRDEAIADRHLNPAVRDAAENNIELTRRSSVNYNTNSSGGDVGSGVAGAMEAGRNASNAYVNLAALQEQELAAKNARADNLTSQVAGAKRQIFQDKLSAFEQNQQASGALLHAGISNFIGNLDYKSQLEQMRERDKLYNNPQNTVPVVQP